MDTLSGMDVLLTSSGQHPRRGWEPVTRGAFRRSASRDPLLAELTAWQAVLPEEACFTHVTGARLLGLWLPRLPQATDVVVQLPADAHPVRRPGLRALRAAANGPPLVIGGLPVAPVGDVLLSLCRDLDDLDALMSVDSALHLGLTDPVRLAGAATARRRGAPRLRRVLALADGRSESSWETVLREFHRAVEAAVTPQFEVRDDLGRFVARGDLRVDGTKVLHEYDGHHPLEVERQRADLRRARRLEAAGWVRRGYTSRDLLRDTRDLLADVDRTLGRTHAPRRLDAWHAWCVRQHSPPLAAPGWPGDCADDAGSTAHGRIVRTVACARRVAAPGPRDDVALPGLLDLHARQGGA